MASFDDLGRALRDDAAANAPRASAIDVDAVTRAARARRRPRQWAAGTLSLVAVLGLGGLAVAAATPPVLIAASESDESSELESAGADEMLVDPDAAGGRAARIDKLLACGVAPPAAAQRPTGLALEVLLPSGATAGDEIASTVRVTNVDTEPRTVITRTEAEAVIVRGGVVVGEVTMIGDAQITKTLDPGVSINLPVRVSTRSCSGGAALPPGDYTVLTLVDTRQSLDKPSILAIAPEGQLRLD